MAMKETASKCFIALTLCDILDDIETKKTRGRTRRWIQRRATKGYYNNIVKELRFERIRKKFLCILNTKSLINEVMGGHRVISPGERLTLTLRFLAR